jgi:hypothetical protein
VAEFSDGRSHPTEPSGTDRPNVKATKSAQDQYEKDGKAVRLSSSPSGQLVQVDERIRPRHGPAHAIIGQAQAVA